MVASVTVEQVIQLASGLSPLEKLKVIERLTPDLADALALTPAHQVANSDGEDDIYQAAYRNTPEDIGDVEALLPHLPVVGEAWE